MTYLAVTAIAAALLMAYYALIQRDRATNLEAQLDAMHERNAKLQLAISEHLETTELMLEHMTALERRNLQLERKGVVWVVKP